MIKDMTDDSRTAISFEVFPPKKDEEFDTAFTVLDKLSELHPDYISCTYGAGGSRSKKTIEIADYIQNKLHIDAIAHMTCVGATRESIDTVIQDMRSRGLKNVLALRGDRPQYMTDEQYYAREFEHATDLITYLRSSTDFRLAGACYPEKHFEASDLQTDLSHMKQKEELGASFFISQLFFDNDVFYRFQEAAVKAGIKAPVCAGIMPITTAKQINTTVSLSGSSVPKSLADIIAAHADIPADMRAAGIQFAVNQINDLRAHGVNHIHIYTMNKPKMAAEIVAALK